MSSSPLTFVFPSFLLPLPSSSPLLVLSPLSVCPLPSCSPLPSPSVLRPPYPSCSSLPLFFSSPSSSLPSPHLSSCAIFSPLTLHFLPSPLFSCPNSSTFSPLLLSFHPSLSFLLYLLFHPSLLLSSRLLRLLLSSLFFLLTRLSSYPTSIFLPVLNLFLGCCSVSPSTFLPFCDISSPSSSSFPLPYNPIYWSIPFPYSSTPSFFPFPFPSLYFLISSSIPCRFPSLLSFPISLSPPFPSPSRFLALLSWFLCLRSRLYSLSS